MDEFDYEDQFGPVNYEHNPEHESPEEPEDWDAEDFEEISPL
jgi:hypothetical protein